MNSVSPDISTFLRPAKYKWYILRIAVVFTAALLLAFLLPAICSWTTGTYGMSGLIAIVQNKYPDLALGPKQLKLIPFSINNPQPFTYFVLLTSMGALAFIYFPLSYTNYGRRRFDPLSDHGKYVRRAIVALPFVYTFHELPIWYRNLSQLWGYNEGRTVFAYSNIDLDPVNFCLGELTALLYLFLVTIVWLQWLDCYALHKYRMNSTYKCIRETIDKFLKGSAPFDKDRRVVDLFNVLDTTLEADNNTNFLVDDREEEKVRDELSSTLRVSILHRAYSSWCFRSVLLVLGFMPLTFIYIFLIHGAHDSRYMIQAFVGHSVLGITWILISMPLIGTAELWTYLRSSVFETLAKVRVDKDEVEKYRQIFDEMQPISSWRLATSAIAALISFLIPLAKLVAGS